MIASIEPKKGCPEVTYAGLRLTATRWTRLLSHDETLLSVERLLTTVQHLSVGVTMSVILDEGIFQLPNVV
jgi:hypothetical protein